MAATFCLRPFAYDRLPPFVWLQSFADDLATLVEKLDRRHKMATTLTNNNDHNNEAGSA